MVKITLGRYIVSGNDIEEPVDLMTQKINPSKINPYLKKLKQDKRNARSRQLRKMFPEKYLKMAKEYQNNEGAWIKNLFSTILNDSSIAVSTWFNTYDGGKTNPNTNLLQYFEPIKNDFFYFFYGYAGDDKNTCNADILFTTFYEKTTKSICTQQIISQQLKIFCNIINKNIKNGNESQSEKQILNKIEDIKI
jgi:hypothetical protein